MLHKIEGAAEQQRSLQRMLRRRDVERLTGMGRSTLYLAIAEGRFPKPVKVTTKAVAWLETEVAEWQAERIAERDAAGKAA